MKVNVEEKIKKNKSSRVLVECVRDTSHWDAFGQFFKYFNPICIGPAWELRLNPSPLTVRGGLCPEMGRI